MFSVQALEVFSHLNQVENIANPDSHPPPPPPSLPQTETYTGSGAPLSDYFAVSLERNAQGCLKMKLQNIPNYPFMVHEEYKYI